MFGEIKTIIDLVTSSLGGLSNVKKVKDRKDLVRCFLKMYYMLHDCIEDGNDLLKFIGEDPDKTLDKLGEKRSLEEIEKWRMLIARQATRLESIGSWIANTPWMEVLSPGLSGRIDGIIGDKGVRIDSLSTIGSGLVISSFLGIKDREAVIELAKSMYKRNKHGRLSVEKAKEEMNELRGSLEAFRNLCVQILSPEEIVGYSEVARKAARFD